MGDSEPQSEIVSEPMDFMVDDRDLADDGRTDDDNSAPEWADKSINELRRELTEGASIQKNRGTQILHAFLGVAAAAFYFVAYSVMSAAAVVLALVVAVVVYAYAERLFNRAIDSYGVPPFINAETSDDDDSDETPPIQVDVEQVDDEDDDDAAGAAA